MIALEPAEKQVMKIATMADFYKLRDSLNLTDRQREIFVMKYSRGLRNIDIAEELSPKTSQDVVGDDLKVIRSKLAELYKENFRQNGLTLSL